MSPMRKKIYDIRGEQCKIIENSSEMEAKYRLYKDTPLVEENLPKSSSVMDSPSDDSSEEQVKTEQTETESDDSEASKVFTSNEINDHVYSLKDLVEETESSPVTLTGCTNLRGSMKRDLIQREKCHLEGDQSAESELSSWKDSKNKLENPHLYANPSFDSISGNSVPSGSKIKKELHLSINIPDENSK